MCYVLDLCAPALAYDGRVLVTLASRWAAGMLRTETLPDWHCFERLGQAPNVHRGAALLIGPNPMLA